MTLDELYAATVAACAPEDRKKLGRVSYAVDEALRRRWARFRPGYPRQHRAEALGLAAAAPPITGLSSESTASAFPGDLAVGVNADETTVADDDDDVAVAARARKRGGCRASAGPWRYDWRGAAGRAGGASRPRRLRGPAGESS